MNETFDAVIIGLAITSSWGNGHATTYRSLVRGLAGRGWRVLFLEHDVPWYSSHRDEPRPAGAVTCLYEDVDELMRRFEKAVRSAKLVIVGSFVKDGVLVADWVTSTAMGITAFYDIDTPVTLAQLRAGTCEYLEPSLIPRFDIYLSFTGGPVVRSMEKDFGSPMAREFFCSIDPEKYRPLELPPVWDLGYLGTYSADRQGALDTLLLGPARQWTTGWFTVVGAMYPESIEWPSNVQVSEHLPPGDHAAFYSAQRFTLNLTRENMKACGYSPSVRLFEAAACAVPIISDRWKGLDQLFELEREILIADGPEDVLRYLRNLSDARRFTLGHAARQRLLDAHTPHHRAVQLEAYLKECNDNAAPHTSRRNGRSGKSTRGPERPVEVELLRDAAGNSVSDPVVLPSHSGHLYQPTSTRDRDSQAVGGASSVELATVPGTNGA